MKKVLVTTAICLIGVASVMAQGRINFANVGSVSPLRISNPTINGGASVVLGTASTALFGIGPASTQIRLYAGLTSSSLTAVPVGSALVPFVLNTSSGIAASQGTFPGGNPLALDGFAGGAVYLQFTATSINGMYAGSSPIIFVNLATGSTPSTIVHTLNPSASSWGSLTMVPVPEPSSMVLAGLGAASLLAFRRRS